VATKSTVKGQGTIKEPLINRNFEMGDEEDVERADPPPPPDSTALGDTRTSPHILSSDKPKLSTNSDSNNGGGSFCDIGGTMQAEKKFYENCHNFF